MFAEKYNCQKNAKHRHQVKRSRCGCYIQVLQRLEKEQHRSAIHEESEESEGQPASPIHRQEGSEMKWFHPDEQRNACNRCGDVTEDQNFDLGKLSHQPLAINVVKGRTQATPENHDVPRQIFHLPEGRLAEVAHRKENDTA